MIALETLNLEYLSMALLISGSVLCLIGALGILKMPDFITRVHSSSLIDSLGALLILTGLAVHSGMTFVTIKLMIILALLFVTGPTAIHALVNTALHDDEKHIHPQQHKEPKDSSSNI